MSTKGNHRAPWHDYQCRAKYMITLMKHSLAFPFGEIDCGNEAVLLSKTGCGVRDAIGNLKNICEGIRLWQYIIMPDHLHLLLNVENKLEEPLGNYMARLKIEANERCGVKVFEDGFNDQIITPNRSLDVIFKYIRNNPHRLAVRKMHPEHFRRLSRIELCGQVCSAYGNINLLHNPFKEQVVCHRADSEETKQSNSRKWLYTAANGGVLVSPFISPDEKEMRKAAEKLGAKIILINNRPFADREKPSAHDFSLCEEGRLLILTPTGLPYALSRSACMAMNTFASQLVTLLNKP